MGYLEAGTPNLDFTVQKFLQRFELGIKIFILNGLQKA